MSLIVGYIQQTPVVLVLAATSIFCAASTFSLYWGERFFRERRQYKALLFPKVTIDTIVPEAEGFGITLWLVGKNTSNREISHAARALGLSRSALYRRLEKHGH